MPQDEIRLWQSALLARPKSPQWDEYDWDGVEQLAAQQEYVTQVYAGLTPIIGQLAQVEEGLSVLLTDLGRRDGLAEGTALRLERLTFGQAVSRLAKILVAQGKEGVLAPEMDVLRSAVDIRNRLTHGRIQIGLSMRHPQIDYEPVIVVIDHREDTYELDERSHMELASSALEALVDVMLELGAPQSYATASEADAGE